MVSGRQISFWHDAWAGQPLSTDRSAPFVQRTISVFHTKNCFHRLIPALVTLQQSEAYDKLNSFSPMTGSDKVIWHLSNLGVFTVSSIYKILSQCGKIRSSVSSIWKAKVTPSMCLFFFLLLHKRLLTHDVMQRRNLAHTPGCVMCAHCPVETAAHLFFLCPFAVTIWDALSAAAGYTVMKPKETPLLTYLAFAPTGNERRRTWLVTFVTATYLIWRERNERTFTNTSTADFIVAARVFQDSAIYLKHC